MFASPALKRSNVQQTPGDNLETLSQLSDANRALFYLPYNLIWRTAHMKPPTEKRLRTRSEHN